jgi:hypothetical protein
MVEKYMVLFPWKVVNFAVFTCETGKIRLMIRLSHFNSMVESQRRQECGFPILCYGDQ